MIIITIRYAHCEDVILINLSHVYDLMTTTTLTNDLAHSFIRCWDFCHLLLYCFVIIIFRVFGGLAQSSRFIWLSYLLATLRLVFFCMRRWINVSLRVSHSFLRNFFFFELIFYICISGFQGRLSCNLGFLINHYFFLLFLVVLQPRCIPRFILRNHFFFNIVASTMTRGWL